LFLSDIFISIFNVIFLTSFTVSGRVLAVRPDGRIVYYAPGERDGFTVGDQLPPATAVAQA